jgi:hypothetical protein
MPSGGVEEMVVVTRVRGAFSARVTMARLWADGVRCEVRGSLDGPYPSLGEVEILVPKAELQDALEILASTEALADSIEVDEVGEAEEDGEGSSALVLLGALAAAALAVVVALVLTLH